MATDIVPGINSAPIMYNSYCPPHELKVALTALETVATFARQ